MSCLIEKNEARARRGGVRYQFTPHVSSNWNSWNLFKKSESYFLNASVYKNVYIN